MGEPIIMEFEELLRECAFSPFTFDDVDTDGRVVDPDAAVLLHTENRIYHIYTDPVEHREIVMHGERLPVTACYAAGNLVLSGQRAMVKGVMARPVAVRETTAGTLEPGMIVMHHPAMGNSALFGMVAHVIRSDVMLIYLRTYIDDTGPWDDRVLLWFIVPPTEMIRILVEAEECTLK